MTRTLLTALCIIALLNSPVTFNTALAAGMSLQQAIEQARKQTGGRILDASTVEQNGRQVHQVKILTPDGRVKILTYPAN